MSYATVRIENDGEAGFLTKITNAQTGESIRPVTEVDIHVQARELPTIRLTLETAFFLWRGKPELVTPLQTIVAEMRVQAHSGWVGDNPIGKALAAWADRIEQQIAAATNLGWEPDA